MSKPFHFLRIRAMSSFASLPATASILVPIILIAAMSTAGCGGSDSSTPTVVPPPKPNVAISPSNIDPPGTIELPPGEIPDPGTQDQQPGSDGGLEMPADATLGDAAESGSAGETSDESGPATGDSSRIEVGYQQWSEIVATAESSQKVTVIDLWSLSCEPCLKEFPGLVRLAEQFGDSVACMSVNLDFDGRKSRPPEYYEDRVIAFLDSVDARGVRHVISQTPNEDVFAETKIASIPAVLVYNAEGEIIQMFVDAGETAGFTYEKDVLPLVTKLAG